MPAEAPGRRLIEVGCGAGFFLKAAERAGWQVEGIELSAEASRFAIERLELPIRRERAEDAPIGPASFDAAAMFDVIEHLFDPRAVLAAIARALAPGGTLVISTPNIDSASRYLLGVGLGGPEPAGACLLLQRGQPSPTARGDRVLRRALRPRACRVGAQETINFRYTHAPEGLRARLTEWIVLRVGPRWRGACSAQDDRTRSSASRDDGS